MLKILMTALSPRWALISILKIVGATIWSVGLIIYLVSPKDFLIIYSLFVFILYVVFLIVAIIALHERPEKLEEFGKKPFKDIWDSFSR